MIPTSQNKNQAPYLQTSRSFPTDMALLEPVLGKMYIDVALAMNARTIGIFNLNQNVTGERWFNPTTPSQPRQTYRQVFTFGALAPGATATIAHGIVGITACTDIYGTANTAVPDFRPIPYSSVTAVTAQIELNVTPTNIVVINGSTAPAITSLIVVLEYLLN